jgi:hypothetical protein
MDWRLREGKKVLLWVEEAQNVSKKVLAHGDTDDPQARLGNLGELQPRAG